MELEYKYIFMWQSACFGCIYSKKQRAWAANVPVLQVHEVLQVELSGVLGEIDGVDILKEKTTTTTTGEMRE